MDRAPPTQVTVSWRRHGSNLEHSFSFDATKTSGDTFVADGRDDSGAYHVAGVIRDELLAFYKSYDDGRLWEYRLRNTLAELPFLTANQAPYHGTFESLRTPGGGIAHAKLEPTARTSPDAAPAETKA